MIIDIAAHQFETYVIKSSKKLIIVDFWAPWCGPCKVMDPILKEVSATFPRDLEIVKINVDDEPKLAEAYKIKSIPSILFFVNVPGKHEKEAVVIMTRTVDRATMIQKVQELLK